ncbi:prepilin-type N-terminal cleavage/methylation domain-containing protein [Cyanobium sp. FACHB-13342]|uniref:prepilin-type N-terminal cleavage/methylation domain-containing protein n=1 Tax=Cyanobium sp. FACHB-13342 TaxID=2692793 RepID=UPI0016805A13|nr:prepilin-type N-terminal cleavage/methylation domain-containing protein [Cyanobium sp. FACHB-13342]MBD2422765.1 prepilin-type N-terminal cleavage/methylation domain-containing protein [Cyanobium sp. FACHB-13342]
MHKLLASRDAYCMNQMKYIITRKSKKNLKTPIGFTLIELLVAVLLLALLISAVASLFGITVRSTLRTGNLAKNQSAIDSDISRLRKISEEYTCCSGVCAWPKPNSCAANFGFSDYYFPQNPANRQSFVDSCKGGGGVTSAPDLTASLVNELRKVPLSTNVSRTVAKASAASGDHLILVTYTADGINRAYNIYPVVAAWCP